MTKRKQTPLQKIHAQLAEVRYRAQSKLVGDAELILKALQDPTLSPRQLLNIYKRLQMWPRIVLSVYRAELEIAQTKKQETGPEDYGDEKPSDTAYRVVGEEFRLGPDRIHELCVEGRQHENEGWPRMPSKTAAYFVSEFLSQLATKTGSRERTPKLPRG